MYIKIVHILEIKRCFRIVTVISQIRNSMHTIIMLLAPLETSVQRTL
nr:MAG TPA: hypothetical protein [Bacteriophage sp.]